MQRREQGNWFGQNSHREVTQLSGIGGTTERQGEQPPGVDFLGISATYGTMRRGLGWAVVVAGSRSGMIEHCMYELFSSGKKEKKTLDLISSTPHLLLLRLETRPPLGGTQPVNKSPPYALVLLALESDQNKPRRWPVLRNTSQPLCRLNSTWDPQSAHPCRALGSEQTSATW